VQTLSYARELHLRTCDRWAKDLRKVATEDNYDDELTKPLMSKSFEEKAHYLLGIRDCLILKFVVFKSAGV
jgi:hypothetical protein